MKAIFILFAFTFIYLTLPGHIFAVSVAITDHPDTISDQPFTLTASISGAAEGQNYLRVDLYKDGSSNYFGETYNGTNWYQGSDGNSYFPVTIDSSKNGSAVIQARLGSPSSSEFVGAGSYKFKLRRYTSSGNQSSSDDQTPVDIHINYALPTSTSTPAPTAKPTNSPTPSKVNIPIPTKSPTPVKNSSPTVLKSNIKTPTPKEIKKDVLGKSTETTPKENAKPTKSSVNETLSGSDNTLIPKILITLGTIFLLLCGIVISYPLIKKLREKKMDGQ